MTANLVILDRDGVINSAAQETPIKSPEEWEAIPGSLEAHRASQPGWIPCRRGNQPVRHRPRPV